MKKKIGIIGTGNISDIYIKNLETRFDNTEVYALSNHTREKAEKKAEQYGIKHIMTIEEIFTCKEIDIVLILTLPDSHYEIAKRSILAGKHTYIEKPIALEVSEAEELKKLAKERNIKLGCAPDTFMGGAFSTAYELVNEGLIGDILSATAFVANRGHENWHPNPEFYYKKGAGPLLDMGPYYITPLVRIIGNVTSVCAMTSKAFCERTITSEPHKGEIIKVEVDTHIAGTIRFENGATATIITSFDIAKNSLPQIELYGSKGTLKMPCPNDFGGDIYFCEYGSNEFKKIKYFDKYTDRVYNLRGLGISNMADSIDKGEEFLPNGNLATHVLEVMNSLIESGHKKKFIELKTKAYD